MQLWMQSPVFNFNYIGIIHVDIKVLKASGAAVWGASAMLRGVTQTEGALRPAAASPQSQLPLFEKGPL